MPALRTRAKTLLAKLETTYGVDPVPTGGANAILVSEYEISPLEAEYVERDLIRPYFGVSEQFPSAANMMLTFAVELVGSGTLGTPPAWGPLLRACAFDQTINAGVSVLYEPITDAIPSLTLYANQDGVLHKMTGARGEVTIDVPNKQLPKLKFEFRGLWQPVIDAASPTVDFSAFQKPVPVNTVNTTNLSILGASGLVMESCSLKMGNAIAFQSLVGYEEVIITDRKPEGDISIQATPIATRDWFTDVQQATSGAFSLDHGTVAGRRVRLSMPNASLSEPKYADSNGQVMLQMKLRASPGAAGNDEVRITCL
jgi:hypothetical protein